jgi:DNA-directed RNA polymerase beta subunit
MKNSIPILIFLRSLGLTEEKILLSINDSNKFKFLKEDEAKTFEKYEKPNPTTLEEIFSMLGELLTGEELDIMSLYIKQKFIKSYF